jgi:hypothetical protein
VSFVWIVLNPATKSVTSAFLLLEQLNKTRRNNGANKYFIEIEYVFIGQKYT